MKWNELEESERQRFIDEVKETIAEADDVKEDLNYLKGYLFLHESNYNNADVTSGMTCYLDSEIDEFVDEAFDLIKEAPDRCSSCGKLLDEEHYKYSHDTYPGGVDVYPISYECPFCEYFECLM